MGFPQELFIPAYFLKTKQYDEATDKQGIKNFKIDLFNRSLHTEYLVFY